MNEGSSNEIFYKLVKTLYDVVLDLVSPSSFKKKKKNFNFQTLFNE